MGAAVSVPNGNVWCRWESFFVMMECIGRTELCISWERVLPLARGSWTLEGFQSVTGMAWRDVEAVFYGLFYGVMETDEFDARAQRPSHAGEDAQFPDENGERPSPNSDALSMHEMTRGRWALKFLEKQICKPFADKLEKGWDLKEMNAPLLEPLEPRKAMEELATDFYIHVKRHPVAGAATLIKEATETEKQSWTLNSAEECQAFQRRQEAEKVLQRIKVDISKRRSGDKNRKEGASVPDNGTNPGSDPTEAGL